MATTKKPTRKKSINDLMTQRKRIYNLATQLGARRRNGTVVVDGVMNQFDENNGGNTTAARRANRAIRESVRRATNIESSKQYKADSQRSEEAHYNKGYEAYLVSEDKKNNRKYSLRMQKGVPATKTSQFKGRGGFNTRQMSAGFIAG